MSQLKVDTITNEAGTGSPSLPNGLTVGGVNYPSTGPLSNRNKIINGAMVIDQRNAGAAITAAGFSVDRFNVINTTDGAFSAQQDSSAPVGFVNSLKFTTTTADATLTTTQAANIQHAIEGTNIYDLAWGTADAKAVTLSFWVRSSLTGTFGGALRNSGSSRAYPFTYTISSANTWEYKAVTIPGDTAGTWLTTTGLGIGVAFGLGAGPDRSGTAGAWNSNNNTSATGAVSVIGTLNATWQITGVQLEAGTVATPFEHRSFGQELALCQRYFEKSYQTDTALGASTGATGGIHEYLVNTGSGFQQVGGNSSFLFRTPKRASPSMSFYDYGGNISRVGQRFGTQNISFIAGALVPNQVGFYIDAQISPGPAHAGFHWAANSEL
jgi:hypothetical protein